MIVILFSVYLVTVDVTLAIYNITINAFTDYLTAAKFLWLEASVMIFLARNLTRTKINSRFPGAVEQSNTITVASVADGFVDSQHGCPGTFPRLRWSCKGERCGSTWDTVGRSQTGMLQTCSDHAPGLCQSWMDLDIADTSSALHRCITSLPPNNAPHNYYYLLFIITPEGSIHKHTKHTYKIEREIQAGDEVKINNPPWINSNRLSMQSGFS